MGAGRPRVHAAVRPLLAIGVVLVTLLSPTWPPAPSSLHGFADVPAGGSVPHDGRVFAVAFLEPLAYNATRDTTLAGALVCSHRPCGPLVWLNGDRTGRGPFLLESDAATFT